MRRIFLLALLAAALAPNAARADDTDPAFRIGGGIGLFAWSDVTFDAVSLHQHSDEYAIGILSPSLSLDVGALVLPWLAFGVVGQASYTSRLPVGSASSTASEVFAYQILAYAEGSFRLDIVRPFFRVYGGVAGSDTHPAFTSAPAGTLPALSGSTVVQGAVGGALGVHCFVTPSFSISPYVAALYMAGNGQAGTPSGLSYSLETISLQIGATFFGWID
jgi:hypothetical protein